MRTLLFFAGSTLGSIAFQASIALYPQTLQQYAWLVKWLWMAWAIIWIAWLLFHPKFLGSLFNGKAERPRDEHRDSVRIKDSFTQKQEFNPVFAPKIEIGTIAPTPTSPPAPQSAVPPRKPNVHYKSARTCYLGIDEDVTGGFILREIDHDTGASGIVVCYRNEPTAGIRTASDVAVHLTLRDAEGKEIGTGVSKACWLNTPKDDIDLEPDIPQHVVLLVAEKEEVTVPWKEWRSSVGRLESGFYSPPRPVASIEVEIIDSRGEPLMPKLTFSVSMGAGPLAAGFTPPS
jgi:hypothetical protein